MLLSPAALSVTLDSFIWNTVQVFSQFIALTAAFLYHSTYSHLFYSIRLVIFIVKVTVANLCAICHLPVCIETPLPTPSNQKHFPGLPDKLPSNCFKDFSGPLHIRKDLAKLPSSPLQTSSWMYAVLPSRILAKLKLLVCKDCGLASHLVWQPSPLASTCLVFELWCPWDKGGLHVVSIVSSTGCSKMQHYKEEWSWEGQ